MKRTTTACILVITGLFGIFSFFISCSNNESEGNTDTAKADSVKKMVERGKYLANHVSMCMDCHSERDFNRFTGPVIENTEGMGGEVFDEKLGLPGVLYAKNITPDTTYGIGSWTDEEIARAITRGIRKNGDTLFPLMPYAHFNTMSKDDVYSIIAYLRTLKPNSHQVPERKLFIPVSMAYPPLQSTSLENNVKPDVSDMVKYGEYITSSAVCMDCHTAMNERGEFMMDKYMAGGWKIVMPTFVVTTPNITPDSATGIGTWTEEMFVSKFKSFRDPGAYSHNPGKNNTLMPWTRYAYMDDFDIKAIYRYLRTIPPVKNMVVKYQ